MTGKMNKRNWLIVEGRLLADGKPGTITAEKWLELYDQIKEGLAGRQKTVFVELEKCIRRQTQNLSPGNAA